MGSFASRPERERPESPRTGRKQHRSEEHTSELQSPCNLVCRLLLEKTKNTPRPPRRPPPAPSASAVPALLPARRAAAPWLRAPVHLLRLHASALRHVFFFFSVARPPDSNAFPLEVAFPL